MMVRIGDNIIKTDDAEVIWEEGNKIEILYFSGHRLTVNFKNTEQAKQALDFLTGILVKNKHILR